MYTNYSCIKHCPLFINLIDDKISSINKKFTNSSLNKGEIINDSKIKNSALNIIRNGFIKINVVSNGKESNLDILRQGDIFGNFSYSSLEEKDKYKLYAMSDVNICSLDETTFNELISKYPEISNRLVSELSKKLSQARMKIYNLTTNSSDEKVYNELKRVCSIIGSSEKEKCRIFQKVSHQNIAEMVGLTRESVTNSLKRLKQQGLVVITKSEIIVN